MLCTQAGVSWTVSRAHSDRQDSGTLYSVPFRDILTAPARHRRKGVVEVSVWDGPRLSFRVRPDAADAFCALVDQAAQSQ